MKNGHNTPLKDANNSSIDPLFQRTVHAVNPSKASPNPLPTSVTLREVSLRDGLQSISRIVPTEVKQQWLAAAYDTGLRDIEVGSFVPARLLPQMADSAELLAYAKGFAGLKTSVLVPNLTGAVLALEGAPDVLTLPASASHSHSLANLRKTPQEVVAEFARIRAQRDACGARTLVSGGVGTAFGCTLQGEVSHDAVLRLMQQLLDAGADRVALADTVGFADPDAVSRLFEKALRIAGDRLHGAHFHDTRGLGLANCYAALRLGIRHFDGCIAGIGGCPHAPGASGNVSTEDLVYMLESMNVATGIDLEAMLNLRARVAQWLAGENLYGSVWQAGLPRIFKNKQHEGDIS